jgi:hypothetical protein
MAKGKASLVSAIVGGVIVALAFVLNPSPQKHREAIAARTAERSPLAGALGLGHLAAFVSDYHSLGVASYTSVNGKIASWGALGVVFVSDLKK